MKTHPERLVVIFACVFVAVRVFVFSAGFPLFSNVDEPHHFDCVWRSAHGRLIAGLEKYERGALELISEYQTREFIYDPDVSGVGFEPQGLAKLFDAFYTTKPDGMGIGLSVSQSIIESHRGRLWAVPNDGPGVTFSFSIPRGPDATIDTLGLGTLSTPSVTPQMQAMETAG